MIFLLLPRARLLILIDKTRQLVLVLSWWITIGCNKYPFYFHIFACQLHDHNLLSIFLKWMKHWVLLSMTGISEGISYPDIELIIFFLSLKVIWQLHLHTWGQHSMETDWKDCVSRTKSSCNWALPAKLCAAFNNTCRYIVHIWLWRVCLVYPYETMCYDWVY